MQKVETTILGQKYVIKGDTTREEIEQVAAHVQEQLQQVYSSYPNITPLRAAILTALNISGDLHRTKQYYANMSQSMQSLETQADSMIKLFE
ncbi:MAG TPA: cell division protein ZapA [Dissulfurispiraceae bacterium]|nr:cell division protein ZapA [Dissulfurispiraceae bacterium]